MTKFISKKDLLSWVEKLKSSREVAAPVRVKDLVLFRKLDRADEIAFDFDNTNMSPKEFYFPPSEVLFMANRSDGSVELVPTTIDRETVILLMRPCDAKGMAALSKPYLDDPTDAMFAQHLEKNIIVGLACTKACPECFCTSMGTGPDDASCVDILLTPAEDGFIVNIVTEKGKRIAAEAALVDKDIKAPPPPKPAEVPAKDVNVKLRENFDDPYWGRLADRCIHCNMCSYVCPTCYCFDVRDYNQGGKIERVRTWESCQAPGFTKIAGGHDPRANKGSRLRQRFAHKLLYFPEQFGTQHCIGCGRCVRACPVNIDIREIIRDVQKLGVKK